MSPATIRLGCAGWSLPRCTWPEFSAEGSHLERYAARLPAAEINSSFYRPHHPEVYARWAATAAKVNPDFRFSVKMPKTMSHERRLKDCGGLMDDFIAQVTGLGDKLGCLLLQLPPSLALQNNDADIFLNALRERYPGPLALEARHASWFGQEPDAMLRRWKVGRVLADPVLFEPGRWPGGDLSTVYLRLHGSPRMYYSAYPRDVLYQLAVRLRLSAHEADRVWCIFDNTASGAAVADALYTNALAIG
ncbi:MAG: DUF72 domain-containing protein [Herminiimonas sp.]|nr:DUF72 domain-containing protein [Herminiimonas sp.]